MQPVLDDLALRDFQEQQVGHDAILRASVRRLKDHLVFLLERAAPAERGLPEGSDLRRVAGIDAQALNAYSHGLTLTGLALCRRIVLLGSTCAGVLAVPGT